jgi:multiple sugar transport system ATP-binding protein
MGRAIVREPATYLMDEPLSNLDAKLRVHMRAEIASLQNTLGVTTIYVTHDQVEAMTMGDRVAVMRKGELQQVAPPQDLYDHPVNIFVGGFIGSPAMNLVESSIERRNGNYVAKVGNHELTLDEQVVKARPKLEQYAGRQVVLGIRPESLEDSSLAPEIPSDRHIKGVVVLREPLGSEIVAHFEVDAPPALTEDVRELARDVGQESQVQAGGDETGKAVMVGRFGPRSRIHTGDTIDVAVDTSAVHLFDVETGEGIYQ